MTERQIPGTTWSDCNRKARQRTRPPQMLLTTPESLSLLLSYPEASTLFAGLKTIIAIRDEGA